MFSLVSFVTVYRCLLAGKFEKGSGNTWKEAEGACREGLLLSQ